MRQNNFNNMSELFKIGGKVNKKTDFIIFCVGILILLLLWYSVTKLGLISNRILPNPIDVITSYKSMYNESSLFQNTWYSIKLNFLGYYYALLIVIPLGFIIGLYPILNSLFIRIFSAIRYLPLPACSGIFISIFGLAFEMKSSFLAFGVLIYLFPTIITRIGELQNPSNDKDYVYLQTIKTLGATNWQTFIYVYFPYVMNKVWTDIISLIPISWTYITIVEILNKDGGIGSLISTFSRQSRTAEVFALLFLIIFIGILQDVIFKTLDKIMFPYKYNRKSISLKNILIKDK